MTVTKRKTDPFTTRYGWTPERRRMQAVRLRQSRPWLRSTGPRSRAGKRKSAQNALTHGCYTAAMNRIKAGIRLHRRYIALRKADLKLRRQYLRTGYDPALRPPAIGGVLLALHVRLMVLLIGGMQEMFPGESIYV